MDQHIPLLPPAVTLDSEWYSRNIIASSAVFSAKEEPQIRKHTISETHVKQTPITIDHQYMQIPYNYVAMNPIQPHLKSSMSTEYNEIPSGAQRRNLQTRALRRTNSESHLVGLPPTAFFPLEKKRKSTSYVNLFQREPIEDCHRYHEIQSPVAMAAEPVSLARDGWKAALGIETIEYPERRSMSQLKPYPDFRIEFGRPPLMMEDHERPYQSHIGMGHFSRSHSGIDVRSGDSSDPKGRKYECSLCQKKFTRPSTLRTHMNSHTGERPFGCTAPGCGWRFTVLSNLRRHMRVCPSLKKEGIQSEKNE